MKFCPKCDSTLSHTSEGLKCKKCDAVNPNSTQSAQKFENTFLSDKKFPYVQGTYYEQTPIRKNLGLHPMYGINPKDEFGMIVLFRSVHDSRFPKSHVYLDKFDDKSGIYHYVGAGMTGDQTMHGGNDALKCAKENGLSIHLFWQHNENSEHQYIGKVSVQGMSTEKQSDKNNKMRNVYVFSLKPGKAI